MRSRSRCGSRARPTASSTRRSAPPLRRAGYDRDFELLAGGVDGVIPRDEVARAEVSRWRRVEVDELAGVVRVPAGVELDLGASAKALAADHAARAAHLQTGAGVLVALGGDVALAGDPPAGGWAVRVRDDHRDDRPEADDRGRRRDDRDTRRRPRHLRHDRPPLADRRRAAPPRARPAHRPPAQTPWRTATVAAASCVDANAAATAALIRGADAPRWLTALGLPARLVARNGATLHIGAWPHSPRRGGHAPRVRFVPLEQAS